MKSTFLFALLLGGLSILLPHQTYAQGPSGVVVWCKEFNRKFYDLGPVYVTLPGVAKVSQSQLKTLAGGGISLQPPKGLTPISEKEAHQFHIMPAGIPQFRTSVLPIIFVHQGKKYQFASGTSSCKNTRIVWWDRNGDKKVQPKRELRSLCLDSDTQVPMVITEKK